ncbi:phosphatase PAP2 family protein [Simiduia curdlanivorans]|uniref:Phosphatase PAP2 family protein n=1 Tax=Simiduia curdlanivorans TaxID=1492769 RepID=A0ABV8V4Y4_9GAMM|nr:phosphatase PAP2 family protein [Simiduia curdlanivorans]MDN3640549.1 phosphatase PAP2 family protein [Simiduia curdlanivorans]
MNTYSLSPENLFGLLAPPRPLPRQVKLENALLVCALIFIALGFALFSVQAWNQIVFLQLNHGFRVIPADGRAFLTVLGDGSIAACLALAVFIRNPRALAYIFLAALLAGIFVQAPKFLFDAARPPAVLDLQTFSIVGKGIKAHSFPSGHSASAVLAATVVALFCQRLWLSLIVLGVGFAAALSRIAVGVHWPADVLVGSAIGLFIGVFIVRLIGYERVQIPRWGQALLIIGLAAVSINGFLHDTSYEQFVGVTAIRWVSSGLVAGVGLYWLSILAWPLAEWLTQKLFKESAGKSLTRVFKFGMVGGSGFVVDMSLYALFHSVFGLNLLVARSIAYWLTSSWNWYLNRIFTFKDADNGRKRDQWAKYLIMCLISFVPSMGTFYGLTHYFAFFMEHSQIALIAGVVAGALFNYVVAGFLIFKVYGQENEESRA